ncbi:MAG: kelch repeat-containing protein [Planctomycetota bacterium]
MLHPARPHPPSSPPGSGRRAARFAALLGVLLAGAAPAVAEEHLSHSGGAILGGSITYHLEGEAGRIFALLPSTTTGPTTLPGGHVLDIGLDLLDLLQVGVLDPGTGQAAVLFPLPAEPAFQGVVVYAQYVTIGPPTPPIEAVSNRVAAALAMPGTTVYTVAPVVTARQGHSATALSDETVLVAGGDEPDESGNLTALDTLEIYDPNTQGFALLPARLSHARSTHTATLLADGRVLLLGGYDVTETVRNTGDIFDPATGAVTPIASMAQARTQHTATLLANGRVLVVGGSELFDLGDLLGSLAQSVKSAEVYDPAANAWSPAPDLPISEDGIVGHAASLLGNGQVLVSGGVKVNVVIGIPIPAFTDQAWRYDPGTGGWVATAAMGVKRTYHGQLTLDDGRALVVGGADGDFVAVNFWTLASSQRYDPAGNAWSGGPALNDPRAYPNLVRTASELVVAGGLGTIDPFNGTGTPEQTIEAAPLSLSAWTAAGEMLLPREVARAVPTDGGERLVIVGTGDDGVPAVDRTAETWASQ